MGLKDNLKKQFLEGKIDFQEYQRQYNAHFPGSFMRDDGKIISHTEMLYGPNHKRSAQKDWDNILEVDQSNEARDIELEDLKNQQVFYNPYKPGVRDQYGKEVTGVNLIQNNMKIKKRVQEILKNSDETQKFMSARTFEKYKYNRDKNSKPYTSIIDKLENPDRVKGIQNTNDKLTSEDKLKILSEVNKSFDDLSAIIHRNKETPEFGSPETWEMKVDDHLKTYFKPEKTLEEIIKKEPDPDLNKGIGYLMGAPLKDEK